MTNPEMIERVRELRQRGRTPKEIARALGLPPAAVAPLIRAVATVQPTREATLVGCWVNLGWASGLIVTGHADWPGVGATAESTGESGLVNILVARERGSRVSVCGYLVDAWCLGVKNALGPKSVDRRSGCVSHLGPWDGSSDITFGHEGKPMYVQGPHDDAAHIIRTLRRRVGDDNFHYICEISP